jgi:hypothetical protein
VTANPYQSKTARATAVSPFVRAGNVMLPTKEVANMEAEIAWDVEAFIEEATSFPNGTHDDQVDALSQYLEQMYLIGGEVSVSVPEGNLPKVGRTAPRSGQRIGAAGLGATQQRLTRRALGK